MGDPFMDFLDQLSDQFRSLETRKRQISRRQIKIACADRNTLPIQRPNGLFAATVLVAILNIIMNERCVVDELAGGTKANNILGRQTDSQARMDAELDTHASTTCTQMINRGFNDV